MIFPDVIEIVCKKGNLYFHALGKRQEMISKLNECYFPEIISSEGSFEKQFNNFTGNIEQLESYIKPYLSNLEYPIGEGIIPNITLRSYFHKY